MDHVNSCFIRNFYNSSRVEYIKLFRIILFRSSKRLKQDFYLFVAITIDPFIFAYNYVSSDKLLLRVKFYHKSLSSPL